MPWPLGPPDGRYLVRADGAEPEAPPTHVLVFATLGAPQRRRLLSRRRRRRPAAPEPDPEAVSTGRATVISVASPLADEAAARRWLAAAGEGALAQDLAVLSRALHAYRLVTTDPYRHELGRSQLLVARIGYGAGEEVAEGRWSEALELPAPQARRRRVRVLEPQARLAAVLGGRDRLLGCEELTLRARADLDAGRLREAALQLRVALDAALAELAADPAAVALAPRLAELEGRREAVAAAAEAALTEDLVEAHRPAVELTLGRLEAALRARALAAIGR